MSLFNTMNPEDPGLAAGRFPLPPPMLLDPAEIESRGVTTSPLNEEGMVSPSKTQKGNRFGQGVSPPREGHFPLRKYSIGRINQEGQPIGNYWAYIQFSTSYLQIGRIVFFYLFIFIVIQLQLSAFSPHPSSPFQPIPPPSPISTLPLYFVLVSFIVAPVNPSPYYALPTPLWLLLHCS